MAIVGILAVYWHAPAAASTSRFPKTVLDPVAPLPCPYEPWPADSRIETHHVELVLHGLLDDDEGHCAIRRTGGRQPRIAHPSLSAGCHARATFADAASHSPSSGARLPARRTHYSFLRKVPWCVIATCRMSFESLNQLSAMTRGGGNATPRRRNAATRPSSMPCTQCNLSRQGPQALWGPADGWQNRRGRPTCPRQQPRQATSPVNAREHPVFLATPPGAHQAQLFAILFEHRVIGDPASIPSSSCGLTFGGGMPPQRCQHLRPSV